MNKERHARLRSLVHDINRQRKIQARKIDILCNDMVRAHRGLLEGLRNLSFTAGVHESLIACYDADEVFKAVSEAFSRRFGTCAAALLLVDGSDITTHCLPGNLLDTEVSELPSFFTAENVRSICSGNRVHLLPELLQLPVQVPPQSVANSWAVAVPLSFERRDVGVLLFFGSDATKASERLIQSATITAPAIAKALAASRQVIAHS